MSQVRKRNPVLEQIEAEEDLHDAFDNDDSPEVEAILDYRLKRLRRGDKMLSENEALRELRKSRYGNEAA